MITVELFSLLIDFFFRPLNLNDFLEFLILLYLFYFKTTLFTDSSSKSSDYLSLSDSPSEKDKLGSSFFISSNNFEYFEF